MRRQIQAAVEAIGPNHDEWLPCVELYNLLRRYSPMMCVDVAIVPKGKQPSVILAKRTNEAVAPNEWWVFGGRVDKKLRYLEVAHKKTKSEIGINTKLGLEDVIGLGGVIFPPDAREKELRDYTISTPALCFAKQIPLPKRVIAGDGNTEWKVFTELDTTWHPYVQNVVAYAWNTFYGTEWANNLSKSTRKTLRNTDLFTPLRYEPSPFG